MLSLLDEGHRFCDGRTRREWLRLGGVGLGGLTMAGLAAGRAPAAVDAPRSFGRAKSVIIVGLLGGPPQHETFDPKPDAPAEIRGEFGAIASRTPGLLVGELMPKMAQLTDQLAVLRAVVTNDNAHSSSGYQMLTGTPHIPLNAESALPKPPNNWPCYGALVRRLKSDVGRLPSAITIPEHIWNDGNFPWPGQDAGFLGQEVDPWLVHCDPSEAEFHVPALSLPGEVPTVRFDSRRSLLSQMNQKLGDLQRRLDLEDDPFSTHSRTAMELLAASGNRGAFDLRRESDAVRDRYGRSRFAQSLLLARRLVESGVSLVQVNWTRIKDQPNQGGWDTHAEHNKSLKNLLMPIMDQCVSALIEDLQERGLLDETLVIWFGEFGRTPRFNAAGGRDHWGRVFSLALCGGGIRGGVAHGSSDAHAAEPRTGQVEPRDILATVFHCLGYSPDTTLRDPLGRPLPLSRGRVIDPII